MRNRNRTPLGVLILIAIVCALGIMAQKNRQPEIPQIRAQFDDATPLGGKGLALMLGRLGYNVSRQSGGLETMPAAAKVWLLLDPKTVFTKAEAHALLNWVKNGGTLIWAVGHGYGGGATQQILRHELNIASVSERPTSTGPNLDPLPPLSTLNPGAASEYWSGVAKASGSDAIIEIKRPSLEIASTPFGAELARLDFGKGQVFVAPDALLFTNYALSKPDNVILVANIVRAHAPNGTIFFDERQHPESLGEEAIHPNLIYYLFQPPLRWALLQMFVTSLLVWLLYGWRFGAPVPLPDGGPVTRASHFAAAMGQLFQKANRPRAAATIIGDEFRKTLARRCGLSVADPDKLIAERAAVLTELPAQMIDRLLLAAKAPAGTEAQILSDAQEMEYVLRRLK